MAECALLDVNEVSRRTALSRTTIWRKRREGTFPEPLRLSEQCVRWRSDHIENWINGLSISSGETAEQQAR